MSWFSKKPPAGAGADSKATSTSTSQPLPPSAAQQNLRQAPAEPPGAPPVNGVNQRTSMTQATPPDSQAQASPEQIAKIQKGVAQSHQRLAAFGGLTVLLMRSASFRQQKIADLEWMLEPAVATGQFVIAEVVARDSGLAVPAAAILWASVSDEIDARVRANPGEAIKVQRNEWTSGPHCWLVASLGDQRAVRSLLLQLNNAQFKDRTLSIVSRQPDGSVRVETLADMVKIAAASAVGTPGAKV